jgi:plasmid stability protein
MAQLLIRNLDEALKQRLRERAAVHGRSMEAEARDIIEHALTAKKMPVAPVGSQLRALFAPLGGIDLADERDRTPHDPIDLGS